MVTSTPDLQSSCFEYDIVAVRGKSMGDNSYSEDRLREVLDERTPARDGGYGSSHRRGIGYS